jgi:hypothetical protein
LIIVDNLPQRHIKLPRHPANAGFTLYNVACGYAHLGELDSAIELLERSMPSANEERKAWLRHDSDLDPLREHPRFVELLRRIEAQP